MSGTVPCETCGTLTTMTGTKRCDACWELERRLGDYLRRGGKKARAFVEGALGRRPLKLYVWDDVLTDYTDGIMFAVAPDVEAARKAIRRECAHVPDDDLAKKPKMYAGRAARAVWGGG